MIGRDLLLLFNYVYLFDYLGPHFLSFAIHDRLVPVQKKKKEI